MEQKQGWANIFYGEPHGKLFATPDRIYYINNRFKNFNKGRASTK